MRQPFSSFGDYYYFLLLSVITHCLLLSVRCLEQQDYNARAAASSKLRHDVALLDALIGLKSGYAKSVIPAVPCNSSNYECPPFVVQCRLYLIRVQQIIENDEKLITTARFQLSWHDPALRWDPAKYGGIKAVILPPKSIWAPDLQIANSVENSANLADIGMYSFRVSYDGNVWFHPTGTFATRCGLDLTYYPFDYQRCVLVLESAIYTSNEMSTIIRSDKQDPVSRGMYSENPMWSLIGANGFSVFYKTGRRTMFSRIHFWLILKRKPDYYERTMLAPLILLSILQTVTYLTPLKFIDRVSQATVILMTAFFFQSYIAEELPRTSEASFVQTHLNLIISMSVVAISVTTLTIELVKPDSGLPMWGLLPLFRRAHRRRNNKNQDGDHHHPHQEEEETDKSKKSRSKRKAILIAAAVNWIGFLVNAGVSFAYPLVALLNLERGSVVPPMPQPPNDNITTSYYAEY